MKKIRNIVVIEGTDLMIGGTIFILLFNTFLKEFDKYMPIVAGLTILGIICYIFSLIFCIIHCLKNTEFNKGTKIVKIALLLIFSVFYIPIYYTKYVMQKKKWLGIVECIVFILGYFMILSLLGILYLDKVDTVKYSKDKSIEAKLKSTWMCYDENIGDQKLFCFNILDEGSFGVFTYDTVITDSSDILDLMKYHSEQLNKGYIKEGYQVVNSKKENNYYISELKKDKEVFYTIAGIKTNDKNTIVVAYSGFKKEKFSDIYKNIIYSKEG